MLHMNMHYISIQLIIFIQSLLNLTALVEGGMLNFFIINLTKNLIDMFINTDQMLLLLKGCFDHLVRLMMKNFQA